MTLEHKTGLKSLGYICSNSQQYIVWVKIIHFYFMPKVIRILRFPTVDKSKRIFYYALLRT